MHSPRYGGRASERERVDLPRDGELTANWVWCTIAPAWEHRLPQEVGSKEPIANGACKRSD
jgi:hypothetical protein